MKRLVTSDDAVAEAARLLGEGELVALPTETVYGLAAHAFLPDAVVSVFAAKERPSFDPLIVHVLEPDLEKLIALGVLDGTRMTTKAREQAGALAELWPGPLSLVVPRGPCVVDAATSGLDTVAVRCPSHPAARAVIEALGAPVVAPSANRFGRISPTTADAVEDELSGRIAMVLDAGPTEHGIESTIVGIEDDGTVRLLRPGATSAERIQAIVGELAPPLPGPVHAPGMLASHYAPRKPVLLWRRGEPFPDPPGTLAALLFRPAETTASLSLVLSESGDDREAARNLFAHLRTLDASDVDLIVAELPEASHGLLPAIRDRLSRAAATREPQR